MEFAEYKIIRESTSRIRGCLWNKLEAQNVDFKGNPIAMFSVKIEGVLVRGFIIHEAWNPEMQVFYPVLELPYSRDNSGLRKGFIVLNRDAKDKLFAYMKEKFRQYCELVNEKEQEEQGEEALSQSEEYDSEVNSHIIRCEWCNFVYHKTILGCPFCNSDNHEI